MEWCEGQRASPFIQRTSSYSRIEPEKVIAMLSANYAGQQQERIFSFPRRYTRRTITEFFVSFFFHWLARSDYRLALFQSLFKAGENWGDRTYEIRVKSWNNKRHSKHTITRCFIHQCWIYFKPNSTTYCEIPFVPLRHKSNTSAPLIYMYTRYYSYFRLLDESKIQLKNWKNEWIKLPVSKSL